MHFKLVLTMMAFYCALHPLSAFAEIHKCVNAAGVISFSDKPCPTGEKAAEVKPDSSLNSVLARENDRKLGKSCLLLQRRQRQCFSVSNETLLTYLNDNCKAPVKRYVSSTARQENRERWRERSYNSKYHRDVVEDDEESGSYIDIHRELPKEMLNCDVLANEMWGFVQTNFGKKVSEEDAKKIDYQLKAIESENSDMDKYYTRKRKRN